MKPLQELADLVLKDFLPTTWLRLIAGSIVPLLGAGLSVPSLLANIGVEVAPEKKPILLSITLLLLLVLYLTVLLVSVVFQHRSFRLASEKFVECRGAFFKPNPAGGYHKAVYCGSCKAPTSTEDRGVYVYEKYICHCGWKSSFTLGELDAVRSELPSTP